MNVYFDTEFTELTKDAELISIGLVNEKGDTFYAELTDFQEEGLDDFVIENVLSNLYLNKPYVSSAGKVEVKGNTATVAKHLKEWLEKQEEEVIMVADVLAWDWILFCNIFGGAFFIPSNILYIPIDVSIIMFTKGIDIDVNRYKYVGENSKGKHNALDDALVCKKVYEKLSKL